MDKTVIKLYDVAANTALPEVAVGNLPEDGDPLEINGEMYFVCERNYEVDANPVIGVIPLVVRNPANISNIEKYIDCLSMAHRRVQFKNKNGITDLEHSDEMVIS